MAWVVSENNGCVRSQLLAMLLSLSDVEPEPARADRCPVHQCTGVVGIGPTLGGIKLGIGQIVALPVSRRSMLRPAGRAKSNPVTVIADCLATDVSYVSRLEVDLGDGGSPRPFEVPEALPTILEREPTGGADGAVQQQLFQPRCPNRSPVHRLTCHRFATDTNHRFGWPRSHANHHGVRQKCYSILFHSPLFPLTTVPLDAAHGTQSAKAGS